MFRRFAQHLARSLLLPLLSISAGAIERDATNQIAQIESETKSRIGVVAIDAQTRRRIEHRRDEKFLMCSTFKLLAAAAVLQQVDRGEEKLDRFVRYSQTDVLEYAPVTKQHVGEGGMRLDALCEAAIEQSDNTAGNLLLQTIGGPPGLTRFARSLGDETTRLDRIEPKLNIRKEGDDRDTTSPAAMCNDVARLLTTDFLSQGSRDLLESWLLANQTGATLIRAGVPKDWRVGDKTGRGGQGETNDVAILYPLNSGRIFVAIYSVAPSTSDEKRSEIVATVTRAIVETFQSYRRSENKDEHDQQRRPN
jgi:beta-lactamase class A